MVQEKMIYYFVLINKCYHKKRFISPLHRQNILIRKQKRKTYPIEIPRKVFDEKNKINEP